MHKSKFGDLLSSPKAYFQGLVPSLKGHFFWNANLLLCDRLFQAFKGVEHAAPDNWQNLTGGPTMSLMTVDLRMPNCRYKHACILLTVTNICTLFLVTQAALMAVYVKRSWVRASHPPDKRS